MNGKTKTTMNGPVLQPAKVELKSVRHEFTPEERNNIGSDLARAIGVSRGVQAEFDQVKASYKAKQTEAEARIDSLSTQLVNGFEMRTKRCLVEYRPEQKKKRYHLEDLCKEVKDEEGRIISRTYSKEPVAIEDMTADDFQADLIQAESKFERKEEIELFHQAGNDRGVLVVGRLGGRWFSALRISVGRQRIEERLDSEQRSVKERGDAVVQGGKRAWQWLRDSLGEENSKGFKEPMDKAIDAQKEREE